MRTRGRRVVPVPAVAEPAGVLGRRPIAAGAPASRGDAFVARPSILLVVVVVVVVVAPSVTFRLDVPNVVVVVVVVPRLGGVGPRFIAVLVEVVALVSAQRDEVVLRVRLSRRQLCGSLLLLLLTLLLLLLTLLLLPCETHGDGNVGFGLGIHRRPSRGVAPLLSLGLGRSRRDFHLGCCSARLRHRAPLLLAEELEVLLDVPVDKLEPRGVAAGNVHALHAVEQRLVRWRLELDRGDREGTLVALLLAADGDAGNLAGCGEHARHRLMMLWANGSDRGGRQRRGMRVEGTSRRRSREVGASSEGIEQGSEARSRGRAAIEARTLAVDVARGSPRASTVLSGSNFLTSSSAMASSRICFATRATVSARHVAILRRLVAALLSRIPAAR